MTENFAERIKEEVLYSYQGGNDDVRLMLSQGVANSRVNQDMARWEIAMSEIDRNWGGLWHGLLSGVGDLIEQKYLVLNGYSRVQAMEMRGQSAIAEREVLEKKERKGLLGLFSGGSK